MLSEKAEKLLAVIREKGGGILDEYLLRDKTGLSHGSIVAGRKELEMAGLLTLTKQGRKLYYTLTEEQNAPLTGQVPVDGQPAVKSQPAVRQIAADSQPPAVQSMPAHSQTSAASEPAATAQPVSMVSSDATVSPVPKANPAGGDFSPAPMVTPAAERPADTSPPPADDTCAAGDTAAFLPAMPHIAGTFYDFDEWTDALMNALGACIYISESLTCDGTYTVYSHEYEGEDTYLTETTEDGFIVQ